MEKYFELINPDVETFQRFALIVAIIHVSVLVAVGIDLWSGLIKAKRRGEICSSRGLRQTGVKLSEYFRVLIAGIPADTIFFIFGIYTLPYVTGLLGLLVIVIETVSVFEKTEKKRRMIDIGLAGTKIMANRSDPAKVAEALHLLLDEEKSNELIKNE